jgi:hypothetical protein
MPQTALTVQQLHPNNYSVQAGDLTITYTASDTANGNSFVATGKEILHIQNADNAATHTFGITSVADSLGRSDASLTTYTVAISGNAAIQMSQLAGWIQPSGLVFLTSSSAQLKFAVVRYN